MNTNGRILIADDEEIMREVLSDLLSTEAYTVDLAGNGAQALEMIRDTNYAVVLLDLMMPEMDGLQVLEELKKMSNSPAAVVLTAYASIDRAVKATKFHYQAF
jgi:CheY-like chemotaxis protein